MGKVSLCCDVMCCAVMYCSINHSLIFLGRIHCLRQLRPAHPRPSRKHSTLHPCIHACLCSCLCSAGAALRPPVRGCACVTSTVFSSFVVAMFMGSWTVVVRVLCCVTARAVECKWCAEWTGLHGGGDSIRGGVCESVVLCVFARTRITPHRLHSGDPHAVSTVTVAPGDETASLYVLHHGQLRCVQCVSRFQGCCRTRTTPLVHCTSMWHWRRVHPFTSLPHT